MRLTGSAANWLHSRTLTLSMVQAPRRDLQSTHVPIPTCTRPRTRSKLLACKVGAVALLSVRVLLRRRFKELLSLGKVCRLWLPVPSLANLFGIRDVSGGMTGVAFASRGLGVLMHP